ncbi:MAG: T9SS type A sorting domain-containing protein [Candidatus Delongbacteria bacterium]|nr:T9SS type A sorting domain-containing protein [Candidatus Delongbacteria bacterium]MBN2834132.1 T9SS type A sorting domain-containing protein [Candidatus Delongbacteria bacterium]
MKRLAFVFLILSFTYSLLSSEWERLNPNITNQNLNSVAKVTDSKIITVGDNETVLVSNDQGSSWTKIESEAFETKSFKKVSFINSDTGFILSNDNKFLKSIDGGNNWNVLPVVYGISINSFTFTDEMNGFAVGNSGKVISTTNGGSSWTETVLNDTLNFMDIAMNGNVGYIVGGTTPSRYNYYGQYTSLAEGCIFETNDGGATWNLIYEDEQSYFKCVKFDGYGNPYLGVGYTNGIENPLQMSQVSVGKIAKISNSNVNFLKTTNFLIENINFGENSNCMVDGRYTSSYVEFELGSYSDYHMFSYSDDDFSNSQSTQVIEGIRDLTIIDNNCIAVGPNGLIAEYDSNFNIQNSSTITQGNILSLKDFNNKLYAAVQEISIGSGLGTYFIYISDDNGENWIKKEISDNQYDEIYGDNFFLNVIDENKMYFTTSSMISCGFSDVYYTEDGGNSWIEIEYVLGFFNKLNILNNDLGFALNSENNHFVRFLTEDFQPQDINLTGINDFSFDGNFVYACGNNKQIYKSADFGENWEPLNSSINGNENFTNIQFKGNFGIAVGSGGNIIYKTFDGGQNWTYDDYNLNPTPVENIEISSPNLLIATDSDGILYTSTNYGYGWDKVQIDNQRKINSILPTNEGIYAAGIGGELLFSNSFLDPQITLDEALKYYPLNTGDVRRYVSISRHIDNTTATKEEIVIGEPVVMSNGKAYRSFGNYFERVDGSTGVVYRYNEDLGVEEQLDSLLATTGDSFKSIRLDEYSDQFALCYGYNQDSFSIFDFETRTYGRKYIPTNGSVIYHELTKNIGLTSTVENELFGSMYSNEHYLIYANINGVEYTPIENLTDYYKYNVGNSWIYDKYNYANTKIGTMEICVVEDSIATDDIYKKLKTIERDLNGNLLTSAIDYVRYDEEYSLVGDDCIVGGTVMSDYLNIEARKRIRSIPNVSYTENYKGIGLGIYKNLENNTEYKLVYALIDGTEYGSTSVDESVVSSFQLYQNYPNPFNPTTTIKFALPNSDHVKISIFNIAGSKIYESNRTYNSGVNNIIFDGSKFSSGQYFYKVETKEFSQVRKMLLIK